MARAEISGRGNQVSLGTVVGYAVCEGIVVPPGALLKRDCASQDWCTPTRAWSMRIEDTSYMIQKTEKHAVDISIIWLIDTDCKT
jgi:hypothetical protein